ncbi:hypothetical protein HMPREF1584_00746 [Gardnerella vaginalis JCP8481A]|nr:hypothetical protein HMPREF1585_00746 [Gardnerella vaginalis JCP8481B]EPI42928.1 hypothetical protein HMPREF1584_00746 [Gardnerella vaginalis JCP8481A]
MKVKALGRKFRRFLLICVSLVCWAVYGFASLSLLVRLLIGFCVSCSFAHLLLRLH